MTPQYLAAPPEVQVSGLQLGPPMHRPPVQTPSPAQAPQSSAPPLQPLPILPQYWPPAGVQVTDGVQAASLPASTAITIVPAVPVVPVVPGGPSVPPAPGRAGARRAAAPPVPVADLGMTFAQPNVVAPATAPSTQRTNGDANRAIFERRDMGRLLS